LISLTAAHSKEGEVSYEKGRAEGRAYRAYSQKF
jgi:hypothetical protein